MRIKDFTPPTYGGKDVIIISSDYVWNSRSNAFALRDELQKGSVVPINDNLKKHRTMLQKKREKLLDITEEFLMGKFFETKSYLRLK